MTGWNISFDPVLPWAVIAALGVLGLALLAALAFARARGLVLRALAFAILLAALANPVIRSETREALSDIAVAVIDRSLSQQSAARSQQSQVFPTPNFAPSRSHPGSAPKMTARAPSKP